MITIIILKPECVDVSLNQLESLVQKVQGCILLLIMLLDGFAGDCFFRVVSHQLYGELSYNMNVCIVLAWCSIYEK